MASKWIKAAMVKAEGRRSKAGSLDPVLSDGRPALTEFMTETKDGDGQARELSALMVTVGDMGGIRAGLKDETLGWCWRDADTLAGALDAVEKALQAGDGAFRQPGGKGQRRKR